MGNRGARRNQAAYGDPYLNQYGTGYGYGAQPGLAGYGPYTGYGVAPTYTITTPPAIVQEPWAVTQWTEYYVPTQGGARRRRPVIYIAAPLPAANPCAGLLGGFGGLPLGGGLPLTGGFGGGFGGGLPLSGGFGGGFPLTGGFGGGLPFTGGFGGANLGYQALPMVTVAYGGGIPGVGLPGFGSGGLSPFGGLGGAGLSPFGGGLGGAGLSPYGGLGGAGGLGGYGGLSPLGGGGLGGNLPLF